jgi:sugar lactone lactonase YvrE
MAQLPEPVVDGIAFPEGLGWDAADDTLVVTGVQEAGVYRIDPVAASKRRLADLGSGGANNCVVMPGGRVLVAQNGGLDGNPGMLAEFPEMPPLPDIRPGRPGLMVVEGDGATRYVVDSGLNTPNDLAVAPDGTLYLTDPGNPFLPESERAPRRVLALTPGGALRQLAEGFDYCNGIAIVDDGVLVTDHGGVIKLGWDGEREWVARYEGGIDGLALDANGLLYVAGQRDGVVRVFDGAELVETLVVGERASVTNCCFGGSDRRDLYVTDVVGWSIKVFPGMPTAGAPVHEWDPEVSA